MERYTPAKRQPEAAIEAEIETATRSGKKQQQKKKKKNLGESTRGGLNGQVRKSIPRPYLWAKALKKV
jgi:hypothetical protein